MLGFLFADAGDPDREGWRGKASFLTMQNTPGLALVSAAYDEATHVLSLSHAGAEFISGDVQVNADRLRLAEALGALAATFDENPLAGHPERLPLNLVGDGRTPRFHDRTSHNVTLMGSESIAALEPLKAPRVLSSFSFALIRKSSAGRTITGGRRTRIGQRN